MEHGRCVHDGIVHGLHGVEWHNKRELGSTGRRLQGCYNQYGKLHVLQGGIAVFRALHFVKHNKFLLFRHRKAS